MKTYTINKKQYHLSQDLMKAYPTVFKGCNNGRVFVTKRKVDKKNYAFARPSGNYWIKSDGSSFKFDKIFFLKGYIEENYVNDDSSSESSDSAEEFDEESDSEFLSESESEEDTRPDIIELDDNEKFIDDKGRVIEIEVRGEKEYDKIYFRVRDVMEGFKLPTLDKTIMKKNGGYKRTEHFVCFGTVTNSYRNKKNKNKRMCLYLTYMGLLKVLFSSRKHIGISFIIWASKTLFAAQLGTSDQKAELVGNLIGVSAETVKAVFSKTATVIPSIYLLSLGTVKSLRKKLHLDKQYKDDDFVYKFGMTIDLERRIKEHTKDFAKLGVSLELVTFGLIDAQYISEAETSLKRNFADWSYTISHDTYTELAVIPTKKLPSVKKQYTIIAKAYMGHISELISEMKLIKETHAKELALKNVELRDKDIKMKDMEITLLKKGFGNRQYESQEKVIYHVNKIIYSINAI